MARRPDSPYSTETSMPAPEGFGDYGDVCWLAQNEGQIINGLGLHFRDPDEED